MKLHETTTCHVNKYMFDGFTNDGASNGINIPCLENGYRSQEDIALLSLCVCASRCADALSLVVAGLGLLIHQYASMHIGALQSRLSRL